MLLLLAASHSPRALLVPAMPRVRSRSGRSRHRGGGRAARRDAAGGAAGGGVRHRRGRRAADALVDAQREHRRDGLDLQALQLMVQKTRSPAGCCRSRRSRPRSWARAGRRRRSTARSESALLLLLEEQESGAASRTTALFNYIDTNGDGWIQLDEFEEVAGQFSFTLGEAQKAQLRAPRRALQGGRRRRCAAAQFGAQFVGAQFSAAKPAEPGTLAPPRREREAVLRRVHASARRPQGRRPRPAAHRLRRGVAALLDVTSR